MTHVDPATLLFTDLSDDEASHLTYLAHCLLFSSGPTQEEPLIEAWMKAGGFDDSRRLLVLTTVFPARALYSVLCAEHRQASLEACQQKALDHTSRDLGTLFKKGDVNIHNVGPAHVIVDFLPLGGGTSVRGTGATLNSALANLPR